MRTVWRALFMAALLSVAVARAEEARISWIVATDHPTDESPAQSSFTFQDKAQAEKIYREALAWIEEELGWKGSPLRPRITVHIGEPCPAKELDGPCMNPALGALYVDEWNEAAEEALAQITLMTALRYLAERPERELLV